jgi:hypothetical protein
VATAPRKVQETRERLGCQGASPDALSRVLIPKSGFEKSWKYRPDWSWRTIAATWHIHTSGRLPICGSCRMAPLESPWPSAQRRIPLPAQVRMCKGVWPPTGRPFRRGQAVAPLEWSAKVGTRLLLPLGLGWARIRDVHTPILANFVAHHFRVRAGHPPPRGTGGAAIRGV